MLIAAVVVAVVVSASGQDYFDEIYDDWDDILTQPRIVETPWSVDVRLGQIGGVTVDADNNPVVFHRGNSVFDESSFNDSNHYQHINDGPIPEDTIITIDKQTGKQIHGCGKDMFYLPHGIHIDHEGNTWVTDVAQHQVFKFPPDKTEPSLVLGEKFQPGTDNKHFCKPTSVVVSSSGDIYVADGYCNSRILKFDKTGRNATEITSPDGNMIIPHSLALLEEYQAVCVADRENRRVQCYDTSDSQTKGQLIDEIYNDDKLGPVYGIANYGQLIYAISGHDYMGWLRPHAVTLDLAVNDVTETWGPDSQEFVQPHDIAVSKDGQCIYIAEIGPNILWKFHVVHDI